MINRIIQGDCLVELKTLEENSVDSIVTDPPYELGFMGKSWDNTGIANNPLMWAECLRVLKPGGFLLSFGGTRTYHRMAVAIEDAGFEVRDMIEWCYGSGFPKSLNIGKAVDKIAGETGRKEKFTKWLREDAEIKIADIFPFLMPYAKNEATAKAMAQHYISDKQQPAIPTIKLWGEIRPHIKTEIPKWVDELVERIEREREVVGKREVPSGHSFAGDRYSESENVEYNDTKGTSQFEGWGTALKPAHEPICMARKPLAEKTVAENCLKYGTGGINIDESRVTIPEGDNSGWSGSETWNEDSTFTEKGKCTSRNKPTGRFPANLIHDNSEEVRECFPNESERFFKSIIYQAKASKSERNKGCEELEEKRIEGQPSFLDEGGHAKETGKPNKAIYNRNNHPTVKPIALMEYLIKMVTPKGGIVLDPFAGSGSTLVAAKQNNFQYIGIEMTPEYIPIIEARLNSIEQTLL